MQTPLSAAAQAAINKTLISAHTQQAATFNDRVRATIAAQQNAGHARPKQPEASR